TAARSSNLTPSASAASLNAAEYTSTPRASVETHRPVDASTPWPSRRRSLSFAVTTQTRRPARENADRIVSPRRTEASFIITASPVARSRKKLPHPPCTAGGTPVTIDTLLGLVKLGSADDTSRKNFDRTSD